MIENLIVQGHFSTSERFKFLFPDSFSQSYLRFISTLGTCPTRLYLKIAHHVSYMGVSMSGSDGLLQI